MYRSSSSGISPDKLREACIDYLQKYASPLDSSEIDDLYPSYQKATKKYMKSQISKEPANSATARGKSYANSVIEAAKQRTNRIHEQIAALVGRDRIVVTERKSRDFTREDRISQNSSMGDVGDNDSEEIAKHLSYYAEVGPVKWRDVHDLQKSVMDIQNKLHKVENFFSSISAENIQRINHRQHLSYINYASKLKESESRAEPAVKMNPVIIDKIDVDKIQLYEKFAKKLIKNEAAKKQLLENMRQEIQTLARKEEVQKKVENNKAKRSQSVTRVGSVERLSLDQLRKVKPVTRDSGKVMLYTERPYAEELSLYHMKASRDYHQEFLKRRAMLSKLGYPRGTQTNSSRDERVDGLVNFHNRPPERQTVPTEVNTTMFISDRNSGNLSSDQHVEIIEKKNDKKDKKEKKERSSSQVVRAIPPKQDEEPVQQPQPQKSQPQPQQQSPQKKAENLDQPKKNAPNLERQMSQPLVNNPNPTEELKTITLKVPHERKPYHSARGKSTGNIEPAQLTKVVPTSSQNIEASKVKNYLPQVKKFLEKSDKRKATWASIMEKDIKKTEKHELLKVNVEQLEEKAKMSKQKIKLAKNKQEKIDEKDNLDQYYLDSIKTKLAIINQLQG